MLTLKIAGLTFAAFTIFGWCVGYASRAVGRGDWANAVWWGLHAVQVAILTATIMFVMAVLSL